MGRDQGNADEATERNAEQANADEATAMRR